MLTRASMLLAIAGLVVPACFAQMSPQYGIKDRDPPIGSNIRRNITEGSHIPINKKYSEMSAEEKEAVRRYYEVMETDDEPPFPAEGLRPIHDAVAKAQQKLLVTGRLVLVASVGPDGNVTDVKAIGSPSSEMVQAAGSIVVLSKFKPALCKGQACKMDYPFIFNFKVR